MLCAPWMAHLHTHTHTYWIQYSVVCWSLCVCVSVRLEWVNVYACTWKCQLQQLLENNERLNNENNERQSRSITRYSSKQWHEADTHNNSSNWWPTEENAFLWLFNQWQKQKSNNYIQKAVAHYRIKLKCMAHKTHTKKTKIAFNGISSFKSIAQTGSKKNCQHHVHNNQWTDKKKRATCGIESRMSMVSLDYCLNCRLFSGVGEAVQLQKAENQMMNNTHTHKCTHKKCGKWATLNPSKPCFHRIVPAHLFQRRINRISVDLFFFSPPF